MTLKVEYSDFSQITRSRTALTSLSAIRELEEIVSILLTPVFPVAKGVRLLGVSLSSLARAEAEERIQLDFGL